MAGDPAKATIWPDADVYVAPLGTAIPADVDTDFGAGWDLVGLLDGEQGFAQNRSEDVTDHYAWGGILVRTARKNFKSTTAFTPLEDNDVVRDLVWPDSPAGQIIRPRPKRILIAFELREDTTVKRLISAYQAEVSLNADIVDKEDDLTKYPLLATIFPDSDGVLFTEQKTEEGS
jgi:hypothetical protein